VAVFGSPKQEVIKASEIHKTTFHMVADKEKKMYKEYGVKSSFWGMMRGMTLRLPSVIKALALGYIPKNPNGQMMSMPADFLIDPSGKVILAYYGRDEGDHIPLKIIEEFLKNRV
jgi:thioredoxin-dependent peroxiredoxin